MIEGKKIKLIAPRKEFIPKFLQWLNDPEILQFLLIYRPLSLEQEEEWFKNAMKAENQIYFSIIEKEGERLIGNISISIEWKNRIGSLGIIIGEKSAWNKGYGTEAMKLLVNYGFEELNLNRMELEVFSSNPRAKRCYEKSGFKVEGCRRQAHYIKGRYIDLYILGILKSEWEINSKD